MKQSLLVAALLAVALSACGKKEEVPAVDTTTTTIESSTPNNSNLNDASTSITVTPPIDASAAEGVPTH